MLPVSIFAISLTFSLSCLNEIEEHFGDLLSRVVIVQMSLPPNEVKIGPGIIYLSKVDTRTLIHALIHVRQMEAYPSLDVLEAHELEHHWLELQAIKAWRGFYFRYGPVCDFGN